MINNKQYQPLIAPSIYWEKNTMTESYSECAIYPLEPSFGHTFANTLRRMLLGGIEGSAVSAVIIDGVNNEFSVINGVYDDVMTILLRLQGLVIKNSTGMDGCITLDVSQSGPVYARSFSCDEHLKIINPDMLVTTLVDGGALKMKLFVTSGRGYKKATWDAHNQLQEDNKIFLNVTYAPVRSVAFEVQKTRVGDEIGYDKIVMRIATDGSITPSEAVDYALSVLMHQYQSLHNNKDLFYFQSKTYTAPIEQNNTKNTEELLKIPKLKDNFSLEIFFKPIDFLALPPRAHNCLMGAGINYIIDLVNKKADEILMLKNFGKKSYEDLVQIMNEFGLSFDMGINEKQLLKYVENKYETSNKK
jgi:DNA-directed RNA polymerase subunit alpha